MVCPMFRNDAVRDSELKAEAERRMCPVMPVICAHAQNGARGDTAKPRGLLANVITRDRRRSRSRGRDMSV
jgi:hypothetical protein